MPLSRRSLLAMGSSALAAGSLVNRSHALDLGVPTKSLLELEAPTYTADACPLCAQGSKPERPGSRA